MKPGTASGLASSAVRSGRIDRGLSDEGREKPLHVIAVEITCRSAPAAPRAAPRARQAGAPVDGLKRPTPWITSGRSRSLGQFHDALHAQQPGPRGWNAGDRETSRIVENDSGPSCTSEKEVKSGRRGDGGDDDGWSWPSWSWSWSCAPSPSHCASRAAPVAGSRSPASTSSSAAIFQQPAPPAPAD